MRAVIIATKDSLVQNLSASHGSREATVHMLEAGLTVGCLNIHRKPDAHPKTDADLLLLRSPSQ
ncbi:hypothetical protein DPMN_170542 [Dreissena polymorpha]|uniref:Uncharacterized protein n=1 Tax=Dreissena polymorpha TaxID=45954 RepID=A0A9D4DZZ7_DREPO|nr:hypothetical protein DPMN_170542 [Dreissena polymorpha]